MIVKRYQRVDAFNILSKKGKNHIMLWEEEMMSNGMS